MPLKACKDTFLLGERKRYSISPPDREKCAREGRTLPVTITQSSVRSQVAWVSCSGRKGIKALAKGLRGWPHLRKSVLGTPRSSPCLQSQGSSACLNSREVLASVGFIRLMSGGKNTDWHCLQSLAWPHLSGSWFHLCEVAS